MTQFTLSFSLHSSGYRDIAGIELQQTLSFSIGANEVLPALEHCVSSLQQGELFELHLSPEQAYGDYLESMLITLPCEVLADIRRPKIGQIVYTRALHGACQARLISLSEQHAVLDCNHPLAGQSLSLSGVVTQRLD